MTDPLDPVAPHHPSGIKLIVMHGAMWPSRNMHIFGKDLTETEARVRVELSGWSPGAKDRVLWAICKSRLNPTKLRRHRPNIQLFPQTLNVERPRCPCLPTPRIRSGLRLYSVFFTEGKLGEDENSFCLRRVTCIFHFNL